MDERISFERLVEILDGDRRLVAEMEDADLLERGRVDFSEDEVERARVTRTLVRELGVNWPGVEIIVRLREELLETRGQVAELVEALRAARRDLESSGRGVS